MGLLTLRPGVVLARDYGSIARLEPSAHYGDLIVARPADLPDFRRPPIDEVVIGLQFESIEGFSEVHTGLYWQRVREDYPSTQSQPRLESPVEDLSGAEPAAPPPFIIDLNASRGLGGRTWLISKDETFLLQIQDNRFVHNWRRRDASEYPHLETLLKRFWDSYNIFSTLLADEGFGEPVLQQLEVSYINWITGIPLSSFLRPAELVASVTENVGLVTEEQALNIKALVREDDTPVGRLYVQCLPAFRVRPDGNEPGTQLNLAFKAPLSYPDHSHIDSLVATGRNAIVRTFTELTTKSAHDHWERTQ